MSSNGGPAGVASTSGMLGPLPSPWVANRATPIPIGAMKNNSTASPQPRASLRPTRLGFVVTPAAATVPFAEGGGP